MIFFFYGYYGIRGSNLDLPVIEYKGKLLSLLLLEIDEKFSFVFVFDLKSGFRRKSVFGEHAADNSACLKLSVFQKSSFLFRKFSVLLIDLNIQDVSAKYKASKCIYELFHVLALKVADLTVI